MVGPDRRIDIPLVEPETPLHLFRKQNHKRCGAGMPGSTPSTVHSGDGDDMDDNDSNYSNESMLPMDGPDNQMPMTVMEDMPENVSACSPAQGHPKSLGSLPSNASLGRAGRHLSAVPMRCRQLSGRVAKLRQGQSSWIRARRPSKTWLQNSGFLVMLMSSRRYD